VKATPHRLATLADPRSPEAEAYRTLRTSILFSSLDQPIRTLLVTGAGAEDGKSTVVANLAVAFAQAGTQTILADFDLRRPALHDLFDLPNDKGVTTALLEQGKGTPHLQPTAVPGLHLLTSGPVPPSPGDLVGTQAAKQLVQTLSSMAELVLFDAPSAGYVADAAILASQLDGVVLVVSAGTTQRDVALRAKTLLEKANARILGVALDNVHTDPALLRALGAPSQAQPSRSWFPFRKKS